GTGGGPAAIRVRRAHPGTAGGARRAAGQVGPASASARHGAWNAGTYLANGFRRWERDGAVVSCRTRTGVGGAGPAPSNDRSRPDGDGTAGRTACEGAGNPGPAERSPGEGATGSAVVHPSCQLGPARVGRGRIDAGKGTPKE